MREFLSFKALEQEASRKQKTKYLRETAERNPKTKKLNIRIKSIQAISIFFILVTAFIFIYYNPFEFKWNELIAASLGSGMLYAAAAKLIIRKIIVVHHGYQSNSLLCDKIVIKEIHRWVMERSISKERLTNVYLPYVQELLEEHKKTSLIEWLKSQWWRMFLLPGVLLSIFLSLFRTFEMESVSDSESLSIVAIISSFGAGALVLIGVMTFVILSFHVPGYDRRFYARLELALTIAAYR